MTDLEMTKLCAEAMGYRIFNNAGPIAEINVSKDGTLINSFPYDPLNDDAQAMRLVKRFRVDLSWSSPHDDVLAWSTTQFPRLKVLGKDLNRAIVECVAKMQRSKTVNASAKPSEQSEQKTGES